MKDVKTLAKLRGLNIALLATLIIVNSAVGASAATSNELREFIGLRSTVILDDITQNNSSSVENSDTYNTNKGSNKKYNLSSEDKEANKISDSSTLQNNYNAQVENIKSIKERIGSRISRNASAQVIVLTIDELLDAEQSLTQMEKGNLYANDSNDDTLSGNRKDVTDDTYIEDDITILNSFGTDKLQDISSMRYNIGKIGDSCPSVVENYFELVMPYGYNKPANKKSYTDSKLLGMELYAKPEDDILAQFNGIVVAIDDDDLEGLQYIKVYHGNSTFTIYSHVHPVKDIYVGTRVKQGQVIAVAGDTTSHEQSKDNHILYQVRLDGNFINPLLIYGNKGKDIYERWITSHAIDNVVSSGERYYNAVNDNYKVDNSNSSNVKDIIFPEFNKE